MAGKVLTGKDIERILILAQDCLSLNAHVGGNAEDPELELGDFLEDSNPTPEETLMLTERHDALVRLTTKFLKPKEAHIIKLRFGLDGGTPMTLREVGEELNLTRERVRQLEERALRKLRVVFARNNITMEDI